MLTFLALYGPDSWFGWLVLLFVANLPLIALSALILVVILRVALAALARNRPPEPWAGEFVVPPDPEATASYLLDRAREKRQR
jgi:hypothetical protein